MLSGGYRDTAANHPLQICMPLPKGTIARRWSPALVSVEVGSARARRRIATGQGKRTLSGRLEPSHADAAPAVALKLLDELTAPALRARKIPLRPIHFRQVEHLPEQVPSIRFLEGQKPSAFGVAAAQDVDPEFGSSRPCCLCRTSH